MTPNKLPPLPERDDGKAPHDRLWDTQWVNIVNHPDVLGARDQEEAVHLAVKMTEQKMAENFRALRQSQSLPAGAVAYDRELIASMLDSAANGRTGYKATSMREQAELLRAADNADADGVHTAALQADAREKGEAVAWECKMVGRDVGWHACTKEQFENIRLTGFYNGPGGARCEARELFATQPAQASEHWVGICRDEHCADIGTVHDYCRPLALGPSTHPQPVTPAGGEVEARAKAMFEAGTVGANSAPWEQQWEPTKEYWRAKAAHPPVADAALVVALKRIVTVLGPVVPSSVTDEGARWEWRDALETAVAALNQRGGGDHG